MEKVLEKIKNWFKNLITKIKNVKWNKVFRQARNISLALSGVFVMAACVVYIFATDLFATNSSLWLMGGAVLGFGAGALAMLSELNKERKILTFVLKGIALEVMIMFVIYLVLFQNSSVVTSLDETDKFLSLFIKKLFNKPADYTGIECLKAINVSMVIAYVLSGLGIAVQIFNITSNAILGIEE